jgi:hypothetical protein
MASENINKDNMYNELLEIDKDIKTQLKEVIQTTISDKMIIYELLQLEECIHYNNKLKVEIIKELIHSCSRMFPGEKTTDLVSQLEQTYIINDNHIDNYEKCIDQCIRLYFKKDLCLEAIDQSSLYIDSNLYDRINSLLDYRSYNIAFEAFKNDRYLCKKVSNKSYTFKYFDPMISSSKLESWYMNKKSKPIFSTSCDESVLKELANNSIMHYGISTRGNIKRVVRNLQEKFYFFTPNMDNGYYTIEEFQKVWAYFIIKSYETEVINDYNYYRTRNEFMVSSSQIASNQKSLKSFFGSITNQYQNLTPKIFSKTTYLLRISKSEFMEHCKKLTGLTDDKISLILGDLLYKDSSSKYSIFSTPIFETNEEYYCSSRIILKINIEFQIQRLWNKKYKSIYSTIHNQVIEPKMCKMISDKFKLNPNFIIAIPTDNFRLNGLNMEFDIVIFEKSTGDVMIIEAKDHIAKLDTADIINTGYLEKDVFKEKGQPVEQLDKQSKAIRDIDIISKVFPNINIRSVNRVFKTYCELYYTGTYQFFKKLEGFDIAFIPFTLLREYGEIKNKSLYEVHKYFMQQEFIGSENYVEENTTLKLFNYNFRIPMFYDKLFYQKKVIK